MRRAALLLALSFLPAAAQAANGAPLGPGVPVGSGPLVRGHPRAASYWSEERMRSAESLMPMVPGDAEGLGGSREPTGEPGMVPPTPPSDTGPPLTPAHRAAVDGPYAYTSAEIADPEAAPYRTHGKVFLTIGGEDFVCSGTVLASANASVVWTAGHCVFDPESSSWASNWVFVPGRRDGASSLGAWSATRLWSTIGWTRDANLRYDMGAAVIETDDAGLRISDVVGGRGFGWNQPQEQDYSAYGYPAAPPFDGEKLWMCHSGFGATDGSFSGPGPEPIGIGCDMTGGSSGGGWVTEGGLVVSNTSYGIVGVPEVVFGPYFDDSAKLLYDVAQGVATPPPPPPPERSVYRPDGAIKLRSDGSYLGGDIYNRTGKGQSRRVNAPAGTKVTFVIRAENDGNVLDSFSVEDECRATASISFSAQARPLRASSVVPDVPAGGARAFTFWIESSPQAPPGATLTCSLPIRSVGRSSKLDTVKATVRVA